MAKTKPGTSSTLPAQGGRVLRTIQRADGTHLLEYQAIDTDDHMHPEQPPLQRESTAAAAWIANAIANPGTDAGVDVLVAANPTFTVAHLAVARQMLFIYLDGQLGFSES